MEDLGDQNALINEGALICPHKPWKNEICPDCPDFF